MYAVAIFDGWPKNITAMTTKFVEPERRSRKTIYNEVVFNETMVPKFSQGKFLAKDKNKNRLIALMISKFGSENMVCKQAKENIETPLSTLLTIWYLTMRK